MEAKKKEIMQMVNECNNERFISFLCSMIKAFKEKYPHIWVVSYFIIYICQ